MAKKKISGKDDILNQPVRYGSPRPNFPRDPGSISIRYGSPRPYFPRDPDSIFIIHEEQKKPCEPEGIRRYGCPRPEISKKPSKLRRIIEIIKEK